MGLTLIVFIACASFFGDIYGSQELRATVEYANFTYINSKFGEAFVELVAVSNLTNKIRGTVKYYYEPTDKFLVTSTIYKLGTNNKAYKFSQVTRTLKTVMLLCEAAPFGQSVDSYITPKLYWPPQANVTYIVHDFWLPKSRVPVDIIPIPIITGRFKAVAAGKYSNKTTIYTSVTIVKIFYSDEDFD